MDHYKSERSPTHWNMKANPKNEVTYIKERWESKTLKAYNRSLKNISGRRERYTALISSALRIRLRSNAHIPSWGLSDREVSFGGPCPPRLSSLLSTTQPMTSKLGPGDPVMVSEVRVRVLLCPGATRYQHPRWGEEMGGGGLGGRCHWPH